MPCSVKRIGRRTSDRLSPRRLCISAKNVTFVLHFPCAARKTKTAPPWEPSHFFWKMRATTGRHYKVNISNFRTENAGDGWSPLQYEKVFFRFSVTANRKARKARRRVVAPTGRRLFLLPVLVWQIFRLRGVQRLGLDRIQIR